jgi:hypothetical protein
MGCAEGAGGTQDNQSSPDCQRNCGAQWTASLAVWHYRQSTLCILQIAAEGIRNLIRIPVATTARRDNIHASGWCTAEKPMFCAYRTAGTHILPRPYRLVHCELLCCRQNDYRRNNISTSFPISSIDKLAGMKYLVGCHFLYLFDKAFTSF